MDNLEQLVRPHLKGLSPYSSARDDYQGLPGIFLDANESPYGTLNRYPDPDQSALKSAISKLRKVPGKQLFLGNGSDEAIDLIFRIFCEPGLDKVLVFEPTYGMVAVTAAIHNIKLVSIPLDDHFQIPTPAARELFNDDRIKLLYICSPNNPTANLMEATRIEALLKTFKGVVIIDEAYQDFTLAQSWISRLDEFPNLVVLQTFSKAWGLAAARIGMAFGSVPLIEWMNKIKPPYNISSANQKDALEAIGNKNQIDAHIRSILRERKRLKESLVKLPVVVKIYPSDANFLLVHVNNANEVYKKLIEHRIVVRNRHAAVSNCIRISIGTPAENDKLLNVLKQISDEENIVY